jgi:hypothetical protein
MPFEYLCPKLTPGRPLSIPILAALRDLALAGLAARGGELSDGIVSGCGLYEESGRIGSRAGIVKRAGELYVLSGAESVPYQATGDWLALRIVFPAERPEPDFTRRLGELKLGADTDLAANELELGRFKLRAGFRLRTEYAGLADMTTEFDTVNLIHARFAAVGDYTVSPLVTRLFAREAYPYLLGGGGGEGVGQGDPATRATDIAFCVACLYGDSPIRRECVQVYIQGRFGEGYRRLGNDEIHGRLAAILGSIKTGRPLGGGPRGGRKTVRLL